MQWTSPGCLAHDPIAGVAAQPLAVCLAGISLVGQHALCGCSFDHMFKLWAFTAIGGLRVDAVDKAFFIGAGKRQLLFFI